MSRLVERAPHLTLLALLVGPIGSCTQPEPRYTADQCTETVCEAVDCGDVYSACESECGSGCSGIDGDESECESACEQACESARNNCESQQ